MHSTSGGHCSRGLSIFVTTVALCPSVSRRYQERLMSGKGETGQEHHERLDLAAFSILGGPARHHEGSGDS